jgi:hypothetical protein
MYFVGLDWAAREHAVCVLHERGSVACPAWSSRSTSWSWARNSALFFCMASRVLPFFRDIVGAFHKSLRSSYNLPILLQSPATAFYKGLYIM